MEASFLMMKGDEVYLENAKDEVLHFPLASLSAQDQAFVLERYKRIQALNQQQEVLSISKPLAAPASNISWVWALSLLGFGGLLVGVWNKKRRALMMTAFIGLLGTTYSFRTSIAHALLGTDPAFVDSAFQPFKPAVHTFWDDTYFYVESKGIPDHEMMKGIVAWQQQVPVPQCYIGSNAWSIPLNPVLAATPVPVSPEHFIRGAVAIAANGVPIFNPYTNTGVDAFLDGQLDIYGGHSGRADDYHYHTAPLHLDAQTSDILPIAFALDGFAVYGPLEPDGTPMSTLDANHGHFDGAGVYHYHGTPGAPYMIGNMVGEVTEDATLQIIPQAKATPIRPSLTPLTGAVITGCIPNGNNNGYILSYTKGGQNYSVDYSWTPSGQYTYHFIAPTGTTTQTYNGFIPCEVPVAVEEPAQNEEQVQIFPNPGSGGFTLKCMDPLHLEDVEEIRVYDLNGSLISQTQPVSSAVELGKLAKGVYVVVVQFHQSRWTQKLIVQ